MVGYSSQYLDGPWDLNWSLFFAWVLVLAWAYLDGPCLGEPGSTWMKHDRLIIQAKTCGAAASAKDSDG